MAGLKNSVVFAYGSPEPTFIDPLGSICVPTQPADADVRSHDPRWLLRLAVCVTVVACAASLRTSCSRRWRMFMVLQVFILFFFNKIRVRVNLEGKYGF
jgi:hypothetical protein